jgi:hypothetical protein
MSAPVLLNGQPVIRANVHLPLNGAWSAELQVATDVALSVGATVQLALDDQNVFLGRVVRADTSGERLHVRLTGGTVDWGQQVEARHYRKSDGDKVLRDLGVSCEAPLEIDLEYWTRPFGSIGAAVQALAEAARVNWRVLPNGTVRIREEAPFAVRADSLELNRDPGRGLVEVAPEFATIQPGVTLGDDFVGDVIYDLSDSGLRCRYYTEQRARLRGSLEKLVRWITRDTLFLGQYAAQVISQAADGSLDLLPSDGRLRAAGLQAVPIRHGLPGVRVTVPPGETVLLGFENGDPRSPYAALWHSGQVLGIELGGTVPVALSSLVDAALAAHVATFNLHVHTVGAPGPSTPPVVQQLPDAPTAARILKTL